MRAMAGRRPNVNRKSAMRVVDGTVKRKNNWTLDRGDYMTRRQSEIVLDRRDPAPGDRHVLTIADVRAFIDLLPDWDELAIGLDAIVLDRRVHYLGWCSEGVVAVCSWERDLWWRKCSLDFFDEHRAVLETLGVESERVGEDWHEVRWTAPQVRAFQLLHILTHELGHHHDRMTTANPDVAPRGEPYAEAYALRVMDEVLPLYLRRFGL
jgi:hypothetical protein